MKPENIYWTNLGLGLLCMGLSNSKKPQPPKKSFWAAPEKKSNKKPESSTKTK